MYSDVDVNAAQCVLKADIYRHESHDTHNAPIDVCSNRQCCFRKIKALFVHTEWTPVISEWYDPGGLCSTFLRRFFVCVCVLKNSYFNSNSLHSTRTSSCPLGRIGILCPLAPPRASQGSSPRRPPASFTQKRLHSWQIQHGGSVFSRSAVGVNGPVMRLLDSRRIYPCLIDEWFKSTPRHAVQPERSLSPGAAVSGSFGKSFSQLCEN